MVSDKTKSTTPPVAVIIPSWNGGPDLAKAIESVLGQTYSNFTLIIVDNGSVDGSKEVIQSFMAKDDRIIAIWNDANYGFTGAVNQGFEYAIEHSHVFAAPFNNDAVADKNWLQELVTFLKAHPVYGIATCKLLHLDGKTIDSTGDIITNWGLPFPRGRDESDINKYDEQTEIFGASGGASMYRVSMLTEIGLFDDDFFAYYEDVDLSFRAQLAGWKVAFVPTSVVYHEQGGTSKKMNGFTTYQAMKNQPLVIAKNVPLRYLWTVGWRFTLAHALFFARAVTRGQGWIALKGDAKATQLLFKKSKERRKIQKTRKVPDTYIWSIITHDLPPNAHALRALRTKWWKLRGKS